MKEWKKRLYDNYVSTHLVHGSQGDVFSGTKNLVYDKLIKCHLPKNKDIKILDLACGNGVLLKSLQDRGYKNLQGVDVSSEQIEQAKGHGLTCVQQKTIEEFLSVSNVKYNVIFLLDVLEHLTQEECFHILDLIYQTMDKNALLVLHIPNAEGLFGMRMRYGDFTHELCFTPRSIKQVLSIVGFSQVKVAEEKPLVHGLFSFLRRVIWSSLTLWHRLLLMAESGERRFVLTSNMWVIGKKLVK